MLKQTCDDQENIQIQISKNRQVRPNKTFKFRLVHVDKVCIGKKRKIKNPKYTNHNLRPDMH